MCAHKFSKKGISLNFDSLDDSHVFIILFEASNPIIDSRANLHRESIEQKYFRDLNLFYRAIIH